MVLLLPLQVMEFTILRTVVAMEEVPMALVLGVPMATNTENLESIMGGSSSMGNLESIMGESSSMGNSKSIMGDCSRNGSDLH